MHLLKIAFSYLEDIFKIITVLICNSVAFIRFKKYRRAVLKIHHVSIEGFFRRVAGGDAKQKNLKTG